MNFDKESKVSGKKKHFFFLGGGGGGGGGEWEGGWGIQTQKLPYFFIQDALPQPLLKNSIVP